MSSSRGAGGSHFFEEASNLQIRNSSFVAVSVHGPIGAQTGNYDYLLLLDKEVATNAILNAGGRADEVRCCPGTREEVISKAEQWMAVDYREDRRIFWLSGPAGAGKSAIVQTLAERCIKRGVLMASFFFFRADGSRNHSRPVVATLLYQLLESHPDLTPIIYNIIRQDRLVFKKSLRDQLMLLIDGPIRSIRRGLPDQPPIVILIDGLDECDSRPGLDDTTLSEQRALLQALHWLVTSDNTPFIALVASRVESHINMEFNCTGRSQFSIYLNEEYQPDKDIRLYVSGELSRIKDTHPLGHYLPSDWPSASAIDSILEKSSGQFIYASTIIRFVANSAQTPAMSLDMVLNLRAPTEQSPFAEIDALYNFILSRCRHWKNAAEIMAAYTIFNFPLPRSSSGYSEAEVASFFSDLISIIQAQISPHSITLIFYHASFNDFIYNPERSGRFHIDLASYADSLAPQVILGITDCETFAVAMGVLGKVYVVSEALTEALMHLPFMPLDVHNANGFTDWVKELYELHDPDLYKQICSHMEEKLWIPRKKHEEKLLIPRKKHRHWFQRLFR